jgi:tocopherol O-methyltransferase
MSVSLAREDVARHYDELDPFYRSLWGEHVHHGYWTRRGQSAAAATENLVAFVAERLALKPGAEVCDIGCGYGATSRRLAEGHGARVTGLTVSRAQLEEALRLTLPSANAPRFLLRDWMENEFPDRLFDASLAIESTEHMPDLARFFTEAFRTLRPGGRLVVCAWLARESAPPWQRRLLLDPICREGRLARLAQETEYRRRASEAGFRALGFDDISRNVARTWTICLARLARLLATDAGARRFLLDARRSERVFALTLPRIRAAYALGAMRYGVLTLVRPS